MNKSVMLSKLRGVWVQTWLKRPATDQSSSEETVVPSLSVQISFSQKVRQLREDLNVFIEESEAEFLALGSCLGKLSKMSRSTISALETGMAVASAGATGTEEHRQLKLAFESLQETVRSTQEETERFGEVASLIDRLSHLQSVLKRTLSSLSFVGLYFSIESVRLPAEQRDGFTNIRSEMAALQQRVVEIVGDQQRDLLLARNDFNLCMTEMRSAQDRLKQQLTSRRVQLEQHFEDTMRVPPSVTALQSQLSSELAEITPTISRLISTLQGHDAVRQRLMHVVDTLEQMAEAEEKHQNAEGFAGFMEQAASVQRGQVEGIQKTLSTLIDEIRGGFEKLAVAISNLADLALNTENQAVTASGRASEKSVTKEIYSVCELISESLLLNSQLETSSSPVESLASQCSTLIAEVSLVLKRTALNTQIHAAHSGDCGGLDALGQQARLIADESITHSVAISEHLQTLLSSAQQFREKLTTANGEHLVQKQNLTGCVETLTATLDQSRKGMAQSLQNLKTSSAELQAQTAAQLESLHFLDKGLRLINKIGSVLHVPEDRADVQSDLVLDGELARILESIRTQYTMEQERTVYDQLTGAGQQAADEDFFFETAEETLTAVPAEDDNLELF